MRFNGALIALLSAVLFGVSPPLAKHLAGDLAPGLLAGLLYLGSGLGLQCILWTQRQSAIRELKALGKKQRLQLLGAVAFGGILAPICLAYGIRHGSAVEVSLLLNLETVATTVLAALLFHEHVSHRVWFGKVLLILGAAIITTGTLEGFSLSLPGLSVVAACLFWGADNNLTRDIEQLSPTVLASVKGLAAGTFNIILAIALGARVGSFSQTAELLTLGAFSYGMSLVLFIQALRLIGASRTSTYFASGPFFGLILAIVLLGEQPSAGQWLSTIFMIAGLLVLYWEKHEHIHTHEALSHRHLHVHDEHHQHEHDGKEGSEPHEHWHTHEPITHSHWHLPDIHHRHRH